MEKSQEETINTNAMKSQKTERLLVQLGRLFSLLGKYGNQQLKPLIFCINKPLEKNVKQISLKEVRHVKRGGKFPGSNNID